jgi:thiol-disulfide isomerase/thioredoxin
MNVKLAFALLLLGLSLGVWTVLGRSGDPEPKTGSPSTVDGDKAHIPAPEFADVTDWVNTKPLKLADQKGKVVVVHFWTNACINCIHNYPHYRAWTEKYKDNKDLVIVGVHSPEFDAEKDVDRIKDRATKNRLLFAIAVDNEWTNWKAWGNRSWPSVYLVDKAGYVRHRWEGELGEDGYKKVTKQIDGLLAEGPEKGK